MCKNVFLKHSSVYLTELLKDYDCMQNDFASIKYAYCDILHGVMYLKVHVNLFMYNDLYYWLIHNMLLLVKVVSSD